MFYWHHTSSLPLRAPITPSKDSKVDSNEENLMLFFVVQSEPVSEGGCMPRGLNLKKEFLKCNERHES